MSNKRRQAEQAEEQIQVEASQAPEVTTTTEQAPTPENPVNYDLLMLRIAELEKQLTQKQYKNLDDAILYFQQKQRKIAELEAFKNHQIELGGALDLINSKVKAGDFEAKLFRLSVSQYRDFDRDGQKVFSLTNPVILGECMEFIMLKIAEKVEILKGEIEQ